MIKTLLVRLIKEENITLKWWSQPHDITLFNAYYWVLNEADFVFVFLRSALTSIRYNWVLIVEMISNIAVPTLQGIVLARRPTRLSTFTLNLLDKSSRGPRPRPDIPN